MLNEPQHVSNLFSVCFNNTATDIGDDTGFNNVRGIEDVDFKEYLSKMLSQYETHSSVVNIRNHHSSLGNQGFSFNRVELNEVKKVTDAKGTQITRL